MDSKRNGEELVQIFVDADVCPVVGKSQSKRVDYIRQSTLGFNDFRNDICKKEYKYFLHQFDK